MRCGIAIATLICGLLLLEGLARVSGLGVTLLYEKTDYGYRVMPSQSITRLGRTIFYNDLGLRNGTTAALPIADSLRILCVGDSITFGGTLTDQEQTYPYLLQKKLSTFFPSSYRVEVLNASAGGWAVENEEGWIQSHGTMGANWLVLQVATHDLFQSKTGADIVGTHPQFPDRQPLFAFQEAVERYVLPRVARWSRDPGMDIRYQSTADVHRVLSSIERIDMMARRSRTRLAVLFVEQPQGIEPEDKLTGWAKEQLLMRMSKLGVTVIRPAPAIEQAGGASLFRDGLHPTADGNRVLALEVARALRDSLNAAIQHPAQRASALEIANEGGAR